MELQDEINERPPVKINMVKRLLHKMREKIISLFEPEEVEVTFTVDGEKVRYTYTKIPHHKQVA
jgi:hypothetical protein